MASSKQVNILDNRKCAISSYALNQHSYTWTQRSVWYFVLVGTHILTEGNVTSILGQERPLDLHGHERHLHSSGSGSGSSRSFVCTLQMYNLYPEVTVSVKLPSSQPTLPFPDFLRLVAFTSTRERFLTSSCGIKRSLSKQACPTLEHIWAISKAP